MMTKKEKSHFERFADFMLEKGPSIDFWFFMFITSIIIWGLWHVLKFFGVFNTPWWLTAIPTFMKILTALSIIGSCLWAFGRGMKYFGELKIEMKYMRRDIDHTREKLEILTQNFNEHLRNHPN